MKKSNADVNFDFAYYGMKIQVRDLPRARMIERDQEVLSLLSFILTVFKP
jgi:hypothetical protein